MKTAALLLCLTLPLLARPQSPEAAFQSAPAGVTGSFFALSVGDLEATTGWYEQKLGLKVVMQVPKEKDTPAVTVLAGGGLIVELIKNDKSIPVRQVAPGVAGPDLIRGIFKVGIIVDDLDTVVALLKERSVPVFLGPYPAKKNSMRQLIIKDNEGNLVQFFGKK